MCGNVLDLAGKKANPRGTFKPPVEDSHLWVYANIDASTNPDVRCDAGNVPLLDDSFNCVLMTELLEHVPDPEKVLLEANRVLKPEGTCLLSVPFLIGVHPDPNDYQRFTEEKLERLLFDAGFKTIKCEPMGGWWAVISDMVRLLLHNHRDKLGPISRSMFYLVVRGTQALQSLDELSRPTWPIVTTGWAVVAKKV